MGRGVEVVIKIARSGLACLLLAVAPVAGAADPHLPAEHHNKQDRQPAAGPQLWCRWRNGLAHQSIVPEVRAAVVDQGLHAAVCRPVDGERSRRPARRLRAVLLA